MAVNARSTSRKSASPSLSCEPPSAPLACRAFAASAIGTARLGRVVRAAGFTSTAGTGVSIFFMAINGWQRENHDEKGSYPRQQSTTIVSVKASDNDLFGHLILTRCDTVVDMG